MLYFCSCTKKIFLVVVVVVVVDIIPKNEKHLERATKALMKKKLYLTNKKIAQDSLTKSTHQISG